MPAPKGNDYNKKWKTSKERKEACQAVCDHIAAGFTRHSFPDADWQTVEKYCKEYPEDFDAIKIGEAFRKAALLWERIGMDGANGKLEKFNAASWIFNMKNRFKDHWRDKIDHDVEFNGDINIKLGGNVEDE